MGGNEECGSYRTRVGHVKQDDTDEYVGRGRGGKHLLNTPPTAPGWLGNPYPLGDMSREECIERFRDVFQMELLHNERLRDCVRELSGKTLGCWCRSVAEEEPVCHGDVIAEWADKLADGVDL